jgi:thioredoxin reductase
MEKLDFDVIIVGGSFAGLSAAMTLGRAIRDVLIIDAGKPCNRQTPHSHNFLTQDGATPAEIAALAKQQVLAYPTVRLESDSVVQVSGVNKDFTVVTASGREFTAKKILLATGVKDLMSEIPGFAECWGISVIHCPYCHGYEYKGQSTGILANGEMAFEFVKLIDNWTKKLTLFTNGKAELDQEKFKKIQNPHFEIIEKEIKELVHERGYLKKILFTDESSQELDALYARIPFTQHTDIPVKLGCLLDDAGYIKIDEFKKTSVPGVYAAGDNTSPFRAVSMATASGTMAGASLNKELIEDRYLL